jgi:DNA N-6-adenine-methyltransferase (Dam)
MSFREVPADRLVVRNHGVATATRQHLAPLMSSKTAEWYTPRHVLDAACDALGGWIDLDPCAEPARAVPASQHFTLTDDGLARLWAGTVYMNPPYGRDIIKWTRKLRSEYDAGRVTAAVALLPARTETTWWAGLGVDWLCLIRGRLSFSDHATNAPFPSAAVYLGQDCESFCRAFSPLGPVYRRVAG